MTMRLNEGEKEYEQKQEQEKENVAGSRGLYVRGFANQNKFGILPNFMTIRRHEVCGYRSYSPFTIARPFYLVKENSADMKSAPIGIAGSTKL